jgi:hypothetical protein
VTTENPPATLSTAGVEFRTVAGVAPLRLLRSHRQTLLIATFAMAAAVFMALGVWVGTRGRPGIADGAGPAPVDAAPITFVGPPGPPPPVPAVAAPAPGRSLTPASLRPTASTRPPEPTGVATPPPASPAPAPAAPPLAQPAPTVGPAPVPQPAPPAQPAPSPQVLEQLIDLAGGLLAPVLGR